MDASELGQASKSGSVVITVRYSPVPASDASVQGNVTIGNGLQTPVQIPYTFVAP